MYIINIKDNHLSCEVGKSLSSLITSSTSLQSIDLSVRFIVSSIMIIMMMIIIIHYILLSSKNKISEVVMMGIIIITITG